MLIEFKRQWKQFKIGRRTDQIPDGAANVLIKRGFAREVGSDVKAIDRPPHDKAIHTGDAPVKRKRGRPRKVQPVNGG